MSYKGVYDGKYNTGYSESSGDFMRPYLDRPTPKPSVFWATAFWLALPFMVINFIVVTIWWYIMTYFVIFPLDGRALDKVFFVFAFVLGGVYSKSGDKAFGIKSTFAGLLNTLGTLGFLFVGSIDDKKALTSEESKKQIYQFWLLGRVAGWIARHGKSRGLDISLLPLPKVQQDYLRKWKKMETLNTKGELDDATVSWNSVMTTLKKLHTKLVNSGVILAPNIGTIDSHLSDMDTKLGTIDNFDDFPPAFFVTELLVLFTMLTLGAEPWVMIPLYGFVLTQLFTGILTWGFVGTIRASRKFSSVHKIRGTAFEGPKGLGDVVNIGIAGFDTNFLNLFECLSINVDFCDGCMKPTDK